MRCWTLCIIVTALLMPASGAAQTSALDKGAQMPRLIAAVPPPVDPFPPERETEPPPATATHSQPSPATPAAGDRDLFRTGAVAFQPAYDRLLTPAELGLFVPQSAVVWPAGWPALWATPSPHAQRRAGEVRAAEPPERTVRVVIEHRYPPAPPVAAAPSPAVVLPAAPPLPPATKKTLYVIPGCYAGDKLPRRDQLRAGCDAKDLRVISPDL